VAVKNIERKVFLLPRKTVSISLHDFDHAYFGLYISNILYHRKYSYRNRINALLSCARWLMCCEVASAVLAMLIALSCDNEEIKHLPGTDLALIRRRYFDFTFHTFSDRCDFCRLYVQESKNNQTHTYYPPAVCKTAGGIGMDGVLRRVRD
jgi:hypothetical protein